MLKSSAALDVNCFSISVHYLKGAQKALSDIALNDKCWLQRAAIEKLVVVWQVLRSLKQLYWPWRENGSIGEGSGFLQAATAASRGTGMTAPTSPFDSLFNAPSSSG